MEQELKSATELNKEVLGDIGKSIIEIEKEILSEEEIKNRAGDVETFYRTHFKKLIALKEYEWLRSLGTNAETPAQIIWHRGALHALKEIKDWFEDQVRLSQSRFDKKEDKPEPGEIFSPIEG